jgi:hypothetical protein
MIGSLPCVALAIFCNQMAQVKHLFFNFFREFLSQPRRLCRFALTQFFHADFLGMTAKHPTIDVINPSTEFSPATMFMDGYEVALLKCGNQLAGTFPIAAGFDGHAPNGFGQFSHNYFVFAHAATGVRDENLEARALAAVEMSIEERKRRVLFEPTRSIIDVSAAAI